MSRYEPNNEDLWEHNSCFMCGMDFVPMSTGDDCCSDLCKEQKRIFIEDYEQLQLERLSNYEGE